MDTKTYHGLSMGQLQEIIEKDKSSGGLSLEQISEYVPPGEAQYLHKVMDRNQYYEALANKDGISMEANVLNEKYLTDKERGPLHLWYRQAKSISSVEKTPEQKEEWAERFMDILDNFKFVPGGRIMHGAGREGIMTTLNNCYALSIPGDSITAIYQAIVDEAKTFKFGGGCGHDLSVLRPKEGYIHSTGGNSCGPVGFMNLYSENTNTIAQHGRRGANMQTIRVDHPDILDFIEVKTGDDKNVRYSNISVLLTHEFMNAVENDLEFNLRFPDFKRLKEDPRTDKFYDKHWRGNHELWKKKFKRAQGKGVIPKDIEPFKTYEIVRARDIWDKIIEHAHASSEPGVIFWDTMRDYHNGEYASPLVSTNPCAEQPLPDGGCCNLGSVNLERFVDSKGKFMMDEFKYTVSTAVRFLDDVIDYNVDRHALELQRENAIGDRRIGLGILGLGDALVRMGIKYDTPEAIEKVEEIMQEFRDTAYTSSIELAQEKGSFLNYNWNGLSKSKYIKGLPENLREGIRKKGLRNMTGLTVAPTGSGAIIAYVTSSGEPIFAKNYTRRVKNHKEEKEELVEYEVSHPLLKELFGDQEIPDYVVTAHDIDPFFRVKMQATLQKYIDSSISSTVNLPNDTPVERVAEIYMEAYNQGLKGITVHREGARKGILETKDFGQKENGVLEELVSQRLTSPRPDNIVGRTEKVKTPYNENMFLTLNTELGEKERFYEFFLAIGKAGKDLPAISEGYARLISMALKVGIPPEYIAEQLQGIGGETREGYGGEQILSLPDAIGKGIQQVLEKKGNVGKKKEIRGSGNLCKDCGSPMVEEEGCEKCHACGHSIC